MQRDPDGSCKTSSTHARVRLQKAEGQEMTDRSNKLPCENDVNLSQTSPATTLFARHPVPTLVCQQLYLSTALPLKATERDEQVSNNELVFDELVFNELVYHGSGVLESFVEPCHACPCLHLQMTQDSLCDKENVHGAKVNFVEEGQGRQA